MAKEQLQVLDTLDAAKTQWYHFTEIAAMSFFTDPYDLFCIALATKLLGRIYFTKEGSSTAGTLPSNVSSAVNRVAFCGTLVEQIFFGWLGDKMGWKHVYGMTIMLMVISSVASGISFGSEANGKAMLLQVLARFWDRRRLGLHQLSVPHNIIVCYMLLRKDKDIDIFS